MPVNTEKKKELTKQYGKTDTDTGSTASQIAILTERIRNLTAHLQNHKRDFGSRRGLLKIIGQRRRLQNYFQRKNPEAYSDLIKSLELRR